MKLAYSSTSPFVRKVRIAALELGLDDRLALEPTAVSPTQPSEAYLQSGNPLGKVPALTLDDGRVLYDSLVICEYLDALAGGGQLLPAGGEARFDALTRHALASGITDALVLVRYEDALRPESLRWTDWRQGQLRKVHAGLAWLEAHPDGLDRALDLPQMALGCLLGFADFRFPNLGWRASHPGLAAWYARVSARPSFIQTLPA